MRILVVAPHADDETIGLGGTIARYAAEGHEVAVAVLTGHGEEAPHPIWPRSNWDRVRAEARRACAVLGVSELVFEEVPAIAVAEQPLWKLNRITAGLLERLRPEILFVPFPFDLHRDHREIFHSLSVAWRPSSEAGRAVREIYCYEVQSETHWNVPYVEQGFLPSCWIDISEHLGTKLRALKCYASQIRPPHDARSLEAVEALARWRGSQMSMHAAEAVVAVRLLRYPRRLHQQNRRRAGLEPEHDRALQADADRPLALAGEHAEEQHAGHQDRAHHGEHVVPLDGVANRARAVEHAGRGAEQDLERVAADDGVGGEVRRPLPASGRLSERPLASTGGILASPDA